MDEPQGTGPVGYGRVRTLVFKTLEKTLAEDREILEVKLPKGPASYCSEQINGRPPKGCYHVRKTYQVTIEPDASMKLVRRKRPPCDRKFEALPPEVTESSPQPQSGDALGEVLDVQPQPQLVADPMAIYDDMKFSVKLPNSKFVEVGPETRIRFQKVNPKRPKFSSHAWYEKYKGALTIREFCKLNIPRTKRDIKRDLDFDVINGFCKCPDRSRGPAVGLVKPSLKSCNKVMSSRKRLRDGMLKQTAGLKTHNSLCKRLQKVIGDRGAAGGA